MKRLAAVFAVIFTMAVLVSVPGHLEARGAAVGIFNGEGSIGVEGDDGNYEKVEAQPSVRFKNWLNEQDAFEVSGSIQSAGDANLQLSASYLRHFPQGNIAPFIGGGLFWAQDLIDDNANGEDDLLALTMPIGVEWDFEGNPFALNVSTTALLIMQPETDISVGQRIDFGLYYYF